MKLEPQFSTERSSTWRSRSSWRIRLAPWQWLVILAVTVPVLSGMGFLIHLALQGTPTLGTGFVLAHDVPAGYALHAGDYRSIGLSDSPSSVGYLTSDPWGRIAAIPLHANTLLSDDELLPTGATMDDVAINLTNPPPITAGQRIDLLIGYGNSQVRVGAHVTVDSVDPVTIKVPSSDAPYWVSLVQSKLPMYAVVSGSTADSGPTSVDLCAALKRLGGVTCSAAGLPTPVP